MSLDLTEFILELEETFDISIPDDDYQQLATVGNLCEYILQRKPGLDDDEILASIRRITVDHYHVDPEEVQPHTRWIEDLKLD